MTFCFWLAIMPRLTYKSLKNFQFLILAAPVINSILSAKNSAQKNFEIIEKINCLMKKFSSCKKAAALRKKTTYCAIVKATLVVPVFMR